MIGQHHLQIKEDELTFTKNTRNELRPDHYKRNGIIRHAHIWCMLKAYAGASGLIQDWNAQKPAILEYIGCSRNTLMASLRALKEMNWLHFDLHCIKMHSERKVYEECGINHFKKIDRIFEKPQKLNDEKQTHYWIYLADIDNNKQCQAYVFTQKIIQNPELKLWLFGLLSKRGYNIAETEKDPQRIASVLFAEYLNDFHNSTESEMYDWLCKNRPDTNRGVQGMADAWGAGIMTVSYIKKKMAMENIAVIQKIGTISSPGRSRNQFCHIVKGKDGQEDKPKGALWNKITKSTFQAFCDDIVPRKNDQQTGRIKMGVAA